MINKMIPVLLAVSLLLAGCNLPLNFSGTTQAWIDAPLDGMTLPLAPYTIVFHASGPQGVKLMEVSINSQVLASLPNPIPSQGLVHLEQVWQPQSPGRYVIRVRAQNTTGVWTDPDEVTVLIEASTSTPIPTASQTLSPTPTPTSTPTTTATVSVFGALRVSAKVFYRADQLPRKVSFTIQANDPAGIKIVEIYFRLSDPQTGTTTPWQNETMAPQGGGWYTYTLDSQDPALTPSAPKTMTLEYQFIITHPDLTLYRGPVYSDISLQGH
jgi:hypothetical protein